MSPEYGIDVQAEIDRCAGLDGISVIQLLLTASDAITDGYPDREYDMTYITKEKEPAVVAALEAHFGATAPATVILNGHTHVAILEGARPAVDVERALECA